MIRVFDDAAALAVAGADFIAAAARIAVRDRGRFSLCMTGGSTPEQTYALLAARGLPWDAIDFFWGDERFVPFDDPRSNFGMAQRSLLRHVAVPSGNLFPIPTDVATPEEAAELYAQTVADAFAVTTSAAPPSFDLLLLGMGDDGHVASLFPGHPTLEENKRWAVSSPPGTLPPPVDRVTLTFPILNAARQVLFLVAGEKKMEAVADVLEKMPNKENRPAVAVRPENNAVTWLLDRAASGRLQNIPANADASS